MRNMTVSIIIPSYNYAHYLSQCIESVLAQSHTAFELIIVDDGSTDNSWEIIQEYARQDSRIQIHKHETNKGIYNTLQTGIALAKAPYFHGLSADDIYLPGFLEKTLHVLSKRPEIGLCSSDFGYFKESGTVLTNKLIEGCDHPLVFSSKEIIPIFRKTAFWIPGSTCIVKRELIHQYGFFDSRLHSLQDWFLFHKIALFEGAGYVPETLTAMRLHANTLSASCAKKPIQHQIRRRLFEILEDPANSEVCDRFKKAALLGPYFKNLEALKKPKLWGFYPYLISKSLRYRWKKLMKKVIVKSK